MYGNLTIHADFSSSTLVGASFMVQTRPFRHVASCLTTLALFMIFLPVARAEIEKVQVGEKTYAHWKDVGIGLEWPTREPEIIQRDLQDNAAYLSYSTPSGALVRIKAYEDMRLSAKDGSDIIIGRVMGGFIKNGAELAKKMKTVEQGGGSL